MARKNGRLGDKEMKEKRRVSRLELIAYHEAGHTVMAYIMGCATKAVSIIPNHSDHSLGHHEGYGTTIKPDINMSIKTKESLENKVMICLAGKIATKILTGRRDHIGGSSDSSRAANYGSYISCEIKEREALFKWLYIRTENHLKKAWKAVEFVAAELLKREKIKGKELKTVIMNAFGHGIHTDADKHLFESLQALKGGSTHGKKKLKG